MAADALAPYVEHVSPISAFVGIAILVPCCLGRVTVFGRQWISFKGVSSLGCWDLPFVRGYRRGGLNIPHCVIGVIYRT